MNVADDSLLLTPSSNIRPTIIPAELEHGTQWKPKDILNKTCEIIVRGHCANITHTPLF